MTGDGLSQTEVESDSAGGTLGGLELVFGEGDVSDCFHRLRWQSDICRYFCWPGVRAEEDGVADVDGVSVQPGDWIFPAHGSLPIGFFLGPVLCTALCCSQAFQHTSLVGVALPFRPWGPWVVKPGASSLAHDTYVDNLGVLGEHLGQVS